MISRTARSACVKARIFWSMVPRQWLPPTRLISARSRSHWNPRTRTCESTDNTMMGRMHAATVPRDGVKCWCTLIAAVELTGTVHGRTVAVALSLSIQSLRLNGFINFSAPTPATEFVACDLRQAAEPWVGEIRSSRRLCHPMP